MENLNVTQTQNNQVELPEIFTANCYYWSSGSNAASRRNSENKKYSEVSNFLKEQGFSEDEDSYIWRKQVSLKKGKEIKEVELKVTFEYSESAKNVYKKVGVFLDGVKKNISTLKKYL